MSAAAKLPLCDVRVLDLTRLLPGGFCSLLLADLGAEVLKVELPGAGDGLRSLPPHKDCVPLWWKVGNRTKRGVTLDLRKPAGMARFERLQA